MDLTLEEALSETPWYVVATGSTAGLVHGTYSISQGAYVLGGFEIAASLFFPSAKIYYRCKQFNEFLIDTNKKLKKSNKKLQKNFEKNKDKFEEIRVSMPPIYDSSKSYAPEDRNNISH